MRGPVRCPVRLIAVGLALTQVQAMCYYSPPPVLTHGQGADTLGPGRMAAGAEVAWGAAGSWWKASNLGDPEITTGTMGAARWRIGAARSLDLGLVGGIGPEHTYVVAPEVKWRLLQVAPAGEEGAPGFHAALVSGLGVGTTSESQHAFLAPYTGLLASGGIRVIQMYSGLRIAASETLGNGTDDLTLYPVLAYGLQLRPMERFWLFAEADLVGGLTATDFGDSAIMGSVSAGATITFGGP